MTSSYLQCNIPSVNSASGSPSDNPYPPSTWGYFNFNTASMQEIIPGLFLGPYLAAELHCLTTLREKGIRYIICVRKDCEAEFIKPQTNDPTFKYLTLEIADHVTENILRFFPKVNNFIDEALSRNCKVLVHSKTGNSRSATLVLAYIMQKFGISMSEALKLVKDKRSTVNPNEGFKAQLFEYEPIYKAGQTWKNGETSSSSKIRYKRKSDHVIDTVPNFELIQPPPSPISYENNIEMVKTHSLISGDFSNHIYRLWLERR